MTDDIGCIYYNTGGPNHYGTGNKILNNKCHDVTDASTQDADGYGGREFIWMRKPPELRWRTTWFTASRRKP